MSRRPKPHRYCAAATGASRVCDRSGRGAQSRSHFHQGAVAMAERRRKFWGWGYEDQGPNPEQQKHLAERMAQRFGLKDFSITPPPSEKELNLRAPRIQPPDSLKEICSTSTYDRAGHSYGKSFRDTVRAFRRYYPNPIDVVAFPRDEREVANLLEWCDGAKI